MHITDALQNLEVRDYNLETWKLVDNSDIRQVLKILEAHPEETIALAATLSIFNYTTDGSVSFKEIRKIMCTHHFHSDFWSQPNRKDFLQEVCSFDPYQLLKTATSEEYYVCISTKFNLI